jgi:hypothetical protein
LRSGQRRTGQRWAAGTRVDHRDIERRDVRLRRDSEQIRAGRKCRQRRLDLPSRRIDVDAGQRDAGELHVRIFSEVLALDRQQRVIRGDGYHGDHRLLPFFGSNKR